MPPRDLSRGRRDMIPCDSAMPPRDLSRGRRDKIPCDSAMPPRDLSRGRRDKITYDSAMPPRDLSRGRRLCRRNTAKPPLAYNKKNEHFYLEIRGFVSNFTLKLRSCTPDFHGFT